MLVSVIIVDVAVVRVVFRVGGVGMRVGTRGGLVPGVIRV